MSQPVAAFPAPETAPRPEALTVFVRGLTIEAGIGVYDHEHGRLQTLILSVALTLEPHAVTRLSDTVNYETVAAAARAIAAEGHVGLVETFAQRLALACLEDPRVRRAEVTIDKPGALDGAEAAGCTVAWTR